MASIVGEHGFRNADGKGWSIADKVFGYIDEGVNIYNKLRTGAVEGDVNFNSEIEQTPEIGLLGLAKPWGFLIISLGLIGTGVLVYKIIK